jgi:hypothetical protein
MAIITKNNNIAGTVPVPTSLAVGELAVNTADGFIYTKHTDGVVKRLVANPPISANLSGIPTAVTAVAGTNTGQLATTAFVTSADNNLQTQINSKAPTVSPAFIGTPTAPTVAAGTYTDQIATTAFVTAATNLKANTASPVFTGQVFLPEGTVSAPGLTFQNDGSGNTGLYHISDDAIGVSCGGSAIASFTGTGLHLSNTPTAPTATVGVYSNQLATTAFVSESKKVQYWSGTSRSYNTVYLASKNICVSVLLKGSYMNGAALLVGADTNLTAVIGQAGDDYNNNTKMTSMWALIPAGMYWKVAPKDYDGFESIVIIEYPFGE